MSDEARKQAQENTEAQTEELNEQARAEESQTNEQEPAAEINQDEIMNDVQAIKSGDLVKGKVVKIEDNQVLVDIGYKYDGVIPIRELSALHLEKASDGVQLEEEIECKVLKVNDDKEQLLLSKRAVDSEMAWEKLESLLQSGEVFEAEVADVVKGGLVVDLGVRGFIPASMVERHFVEDFSDYKGKTLKLIVKELDRETNKVILSQRDVLEQEYEQKKNEVLSNLAEGQEIEGKVQRLTPFGAFVDLGGIDGLVHISEMAWSHVEQPSDVVQEGEVVKVKVLKVDPDNERVSLSMKAAQPGPWETISDKVNVGDIITGTVQRLVGFGAFVEIAPGVEGLVHISQISHKHIGTPHEVLKEGEEVKVKVLDINSAEKRVSLSIKETEEAPTKPEKKSNNNNKAKEYVEENNQGLNLTLGERFGDKLSKFK